jgi:Fe2+ or Zn2+ uptake regulation protein
VNTLGAQAGFRVLDHVLEVEGVCRECDRRARSFSERSE